MRLKSFALTLAQTLGWHPERCATFSRLVCGLVSQGNVQHHALSMGFSDLETSLKSRLERIRRFFFGQEIDSKAFALALVKGAFQTIPKMDLILDRTNWKFGRSDINYLVLMGRVGNIVFPLFWKMLNHQGCSEAADRMALLDLFAQTFGLDKIRSFTADREFVGEEWIQYLCHHNIPFLSA